jgi:hypothetical protein
MLQQRQFNVRIRRDLPTELAHHEDFATVSLCADAEVGEQLAATYLRARV